jgi:hypothetical protein
MKNQEKPQRQFSGIRGFRIFGDDFSEIFQFIPILLVCGTLLRRACSVKNTENAQTFQVSILEIGKNFPGNFRFPTVFLFDFRIGPEFLQIYIVITKNGT